MNLPKIQIEFNYFLFYSFCITNEEEEEEELVMKFIGTHVSVLRKKRVV